MRLLRNSGRVTEVRVSDDAFDVLAFIQIRPEILLIEAKTVRNDALIQARIALGQLLFYEYFDVRPIAEGHSITKVIAFDNEPGEQVREFLAAYEVARDVIGEALVDELVFRRIYDTVNSPAFHRLTGDNQDAVAYASLLVACGLIQLDELTADVANGQIDGFRAFVRDVEKKRPQLARGVAQLQESVREQVEAGNPTPFVDFRRAEYRCTAGLMGYLPNDTSRETMLDEEIAITEEVWMAVEAWKAQGCIVFGLSDKPDEACFPLPGSTDTGRLPIHCTRTHIIGGRR